MHSIFFSCWCAAIVAARDPRPPSFNSDFTLTGLTTVVSKDNVLTLPQSIFQSASTNQTLNLVAYEEGWFVETLDDYNVGKEIEFTPKTSECNISPKEDNFFDLLNWVRVATYAGQAPVAGEIVDSWKLESETVKLQLDVSSDGIPKRLVVRTPDNDNDFTTLVMLITEFDNSAPDSAMFNVPDYCLPGADAVTSRYSSDTKTREIREMFKVFKHHLE